MKCELNNRIVNRMFTPSMQHTGGRICINQMALVAWAVCTIILSVFVISFAGPFVIYRSITVINNIFPVYSPLR